MNEANLLENGPAVRPSHSSPPNWRARFQRWVPDLGALLFFGLVSFILLWPLSGHLAVSTTNEGDSLQQVWVIGWGMHSLTTDPANLFNGNIFFPYRNTLAYADHMLAQAMQGLPVYLLTGNLVLTYGLLTLFSYILSGWGTYLLVKEITANRLAGLFSGLVFAFASYKIGHISQLNLLSTQWIPFCLLFWRRLLLHDLGPSPGKFRRQLGQGWPATLAFTFYFVLNALSSFYYFFYILPLLALYLVVFYAWHRRWPRPALLVRLFVAGALAALAIVPTLIPYAIVVAEQAAERTPRDVERLSANYRFYLGAHWNNLLWGGTLSRFAGSGGERTLFPGALAYLLAGAGLGGPGLLWLLNNIRRHSAGPPSSPGFRLQLKDENRERWTWAGLGLFALVMSFGWTLHLRGWDVPGLYRLFYEYVPGWVAMRAAVRYGVFVLLAVAVLGGTGVAWLAGLSGWKWLIFKIPLSQRVVPFSLAGLAGVGLLALTLFEYRYDIPYINPGILPNPPRVYRWLAEPGHEGVVLELPAMPDPANPASIRNYYSTFHWQPWVNGIAAYIPPVQNDIAALTGQFPSKESLAAFQGIGVRWLVYHLNDENTPLPPAEWQKIEARLARTPEVKLVQDFSQDRIKVYELASNPWMRQAYAGLPAGSGVIVSDYRGVQPALIELFQSMLRRDGYNLFGTDRAGYRYLSAPPPGSPVGAGLFAADEDPTLYGFSPDEAAWSGYGLKFYRRREKLLAAFDITHDQKLAGYNQLTSRLELNMTENGLRFNGQTVGNNAKQSGDGRVSLLLSSFEPQELKINGATVSHPGGLALWRSDRLRAGQTLVVEPAPGKPVYLNRVELIEYGSSRAEAGLTLIPGATLLKTSSTQAGTRLKSTLTVWTPPLTSQQPGSYILTLDIYRRPWGTHPGGHFGTYSIALPGQAQSRAVEFEFNPVERKTAATLDRAGTDVGSEVFKAAGDGDWAAFLAVRRSNPANPPDFPLVGVTRLYEFSLEANRLIEPSLFAGRQLVLLPLLQP